jgi:hypothetical protein
VAENLQRLCHEGAPRCASNSLLLGHGASRTSCDSRPCA